MDKQQWLVEDFERHRARLRAVAYRMLGSYAEAEDAVQDAWVRFSRADHGDVRNLGGWLTTIVARICLNMLQSRRTRAERPLDELPERIADTDPAGEAVLADSVGSALIVLLDTLTPAERLAFVLHDLFAVPFDEIAAVVERSPAATRQLASRARRRVRGATADSADLARQRRVVEAFLAASRDGDFAGLLAVLDPDVVLRADPLAVREATRRSGAPLFSTEVRGAESVINTFSGRAKGARLALIDGVFGAAWAPGGKPKSVFEFTLTAGKIQAIEVLFDPELLGELDITLV